MSWHTWSLLIKAQLFVGFNEAFISQKNSNVKYWEGTLVRIEALNKCLKLIEKKEIITPRRNKDIISFYEEVDI